MKFSAKMKTEDTCINLIFGKFHKMQDYLLSNTLILWNKQDYLICSKTALSGIWSTM